MLDENPYSPPGDQKHAADREFSADQLPLTFRTPRPALVFATVFAIVFSVATVACILAGVAFGLPAFTAIVLAASAGVSALSAYAFFTAYFTSVTISESGIRLDGLYRRSYEWTEIKSWHQEGDSGFVSLVNQDGKEVLVGNFAVWASANIALGKALDHFVGPKSEPGDAK